MAKAQTYSYLTKLTIEVYHDLDYKLLYNLYKERLISGHPMTRNKGNIDIDNTFRKDIDDVLLFSYYDMIRKLNGWRSFIPCCEFISQAALDALVAAGPKGKHIKLHPEHRVFKIYFYCVTFFSRPA